MGGQARWGACNGHLGKLGAHQRARGALIAVTGSREISAGIETAGRNGKVATLTVGLGHDVSTVLGIGRQRGSQARASGVAVSGERFSQAANRLQLEMWLR